MALALPVPPPDPTSVTLRDYLEQLLEFTQKYFEQRLADSDKAIVIHLAAQQRALDKAEDALGKRLEGMNEFRDTLRDQAGQFVTKSEHNVKLGALDVKLEAIDGRLKSLEQNKANMEGRMVIIGIIVAAAVTLALKFIVP